jgi:hypothetical protein
LTGFPEEIVVVPVNQCIRVMKMLTSFKKQGKKATRELQQFIIIKQDFLP